MAEISASIIVAVKCETSPPTLIRVFAEPGDLPLDTYRRVCDAHAPGDELPEYVCAKGYPAAIVA